MASPHPVDDKQVFSDVRDTSRDGSDKDLEQPPAGPSGDDAVDTRFQAGVQDIEAVTISWSKTSLIIAYVFIWLVYFIQGLVSGVSGTLAPYVTSNFALHSLTSTTGVMSAVIGGVTNLSIAKTLDVFGRPQGFLLCVVLATLGLIMSAAWYVRPQSHGFNVSRLTYSSSNGVELYAASQVFYAVVSLARARPIIDLTYHPGHQRHRLQHERLHRGHHQSTTQRIGPITLRVSDHRNCLDGRAYLDGIP